MNTTFLKLKDWINKEGLSWDLLSTNPNAISLLEKNPDKINWIHLSGKSNAVHLISEALDKYPYKIDWCRLSSNPNAVHLISEESKKYADKSY